MDRPKVRSGREPWRVAAMKCLALLLLAAAAASGACQGDPGTRLSDLRSLDELKDRFNADAGKPRIVLLLSPT